MKNLPKRSAQLAASGLAPDDIDATLNELGGVMEPVTAHNHGRPQLRDPADEMALETAKLFEQRAALAQPGAAQVAWDKVGSKAGLPDDNWAQ